MKHQTVGLYYKRIHGQNEQLEFEFGEGSEQWVGPMFWPTHEFDIEKIEEEFYNSLPDARQKFVVRVAGRYVYDEESKKWQLTPLQ